MKLILFVFITFSFTVLGQLTPQQTKVIDSLKTVVAISKNDTVVINAMKKWDDLIYASDPDTDLKLNQAIDSIASLNLRKKNNDKTRDFFLKSKGFATGNLGYVYNKKGNNELSLRFYEESLECKKKLEDIKGVARAYSNIGSVYHERGMYKDAIKYYSQALQLHKKAGDKKGVAGALNNIAIIHRSMENFETALKYYEESLKIKHEIQDSNAIAAAYLNLGQLYNELKRFEEARSTTLKSLEISKKSGNKKYEAIAYVNLGAINFEQKDIQSALTYYFKGYEIQKEIQDGKKTAESAAHIGEAYLELGNLTEAKKYGQMALDMSYKLDIISVSEKASDILYHVYKKQGQTGKALEMLELNNSLKATIASRENEKEVIRQEYKYEYEKQAAVDSIRAANAAKLSEARLAEEIAKKKQHKLEAQKQEQQKYYMFGGLALSVVFAAFIFNRFRHTRRQKQIIEKQKEQVDLAYSELDAEKKKSDELLLNILPEEVAEELKSAGVAKPKHYDQVTVLFTDFKGFTRVAETISPQELVEMLNDCFLHFDSIIERHNLEKIKTIGDAYMCTGGVPVENDTNPIDAVNAACEMVEWVNDWNAKRGSQGLPTLEIRIGIHTGELVAGVIGSKKFAYDVWGDAVNVASRMESSGEPGKVNISSTTYELVKDYFQTEYRGEIEIKNRGVVGMYFVS